jgi:hypothetical protein
MSTPDSVQIGHESTGSIEARDFIRPNPARVAKPEPQTAQAHVQIEPVTRDRIRELLMLAREPGKREPVARELVREIYRLHTLLRRAALLINTIKERNSEAALDITSKVLLAGMDEALRKEPAVMEPRAFATCLNPGRAALQRPGDQTAKSESGEAEVSALGEDNIADATRQRLFTWKLVPQPGRSDSGWIVSPYRGIAIVRAYDPVQARTLVSSKFKVCEEAGVEALDSPWERKSLVRCELLEDPAYDHIQNAAVVYP